MRQCLAIGELDEPITGVVPVLPSGVVPFFGEVGRCFPLQREEIR